MRHLPTHQEIDQKGSACPAGGKLMVKLTRRRLLLTTGWIAGGATVLYMLRNRAAAVAPTIIFPDSQSAAAWVQIRPDGTCMMYVPRMEMGQNANTGLAQIVAEELNVSIEDIEAIQPSTSDVPPLRSQLAACL